MLLFVSRYLFLLRFLFRLGFSIRPPTGRVHRLLSHHNFFRHALSPISYYLSPISVSTLSTSLLPARGFARPNLIIRNTRLLFAILSHTLSATLAFSFTPPNQVSHLTKSQNEIYIDIDIFLHTFFK